MATLHSHKELIVWQRSMDLVLSVYKISSLFPPDEKFGLTSQMRRAVVSIPSNIAEGRARGTRKEFVQFVRIAFGSCTELETQLLIAQKLPFKEKIDYTKTLGLLSEVSKMLRSIIFKLGPEQN